MANIRNESKCPSDQPVDFRVIVTERRAIHPRGIPIKVIPLEDRVDDTTRDGHRGEEDQVDEHLGVHLALDLAALGGGAARVEDDLGVLARVQDDADDPARVPEHGATEERVLEVDGRLAGLVHDRRGELVHVRVGPVALDREGLAAVRRGGGVAHVRERGRGVARLEVRLAVQVLRLDVRHVLVLARRADEDIGRDLLVVDDLDDVAHTHVLPRRLAPVRARLLVLVVEQAVVATIGTSGVFRVVVVVKLNVTVVMADFGTLWWRTTGVRFGGNGFWGSTACLHFDVRSTFGAPRGPFAPAAAGDEATDKRLLFARARVGVLKVGADERADLALVDAFIRLVAFDVLVPVLDGGDAEDDDEREDDETGRNGRKFFKELEDGDPSEEAARWVSLAKKPCNFF